MASFSSAFLLLFFSLSLLFAVSSSEQTPLKVINSSNPVLQFHPPHPVGYLSHGANDIVSCERAQIAGFSRFKISSYANTFRVSLKPSSVIPDKLRSKIEVCFHRNTSLGLCQCAKDEWEKIRNGPWSSFMSPYDNRYVDVKFMDELSGSVTISLQEESEQWRLVCLGLGFILLLLAPKLSIWVPFYLTSTLAFGILLVVLILLFQGMKLLPTNRKNIFYLTIYGSVLGAGSFLVHHFSMMINTIFENFGLSGDMHNPVTIFVLLGILLAGAALGYWIFQKFILSEDGSVVAGVAQFVKWAMRIVATVFIFLSTRDPLLATAALCICCGICFLLTTKKWKVRKSEQLAYPAEGNLWQQKAKQVHANHRRPEFLSRTPKMYSGRIDQDSARSPYAWSDSSAKGFIMSSSDKKEEQRDYYSTFHKTPTQKRFSKKEWEDFTHDSTKKALTEWASSPEFADWIMEHADRIQILPNESSDNSLASGSDSSGETVAEETGSGLSFFKWY